MPITQIDVSLNEIEESQLRANGFRKDEVNLNKGAGGNKVHLWYKDECEGQALTRIQFSYTDDMAKGLSDAGYRKVNKNLNAGTSGANVFLWYYKGDTDADVAIKDLYVSTDAADEAQRVRFGWERLTCDLNHHAGGNWVYLWVEREVPVYIRDVTATSTWKSDVDLFQRGYTRMDDNTNKFVNGDRVYIWYLKTTDQQEAIKDLQVSTSDGEYNNIQQQGHDVVNMDLNKGTGRNQVFLWYKKDGNRPVKGMGLITQRAVKQYKEVGARIKETTQASSPCGSFTLYLYFHH
ncbi:uncharacterized protein LOC115397819 [Salarias fasciatus]|uniref:uncharacterized protein LOC115397819 n=1 Tax=Salarias fasciatus TaxID=181472 RepID=UPI00117672D5|nr:uncharacterized protein LOC115397819 [Salarias fasciatus]